MLTFAENVIQKFNLQTPSASAKPPPPSEPQAKRRKGKEKAVEILSDDDEASVNEVHGRLLQLCNST
jgi:hypothetical protein